VDNWFHKIRNLLNKTDKDKTKTKKIHYIALIGLVGLLLLIISNMFNITSPDSESDHVLPISEENLTNVEQETWKQNDQSDATSKIQSLEDAYEKDLNHLLEQMNGISNVEVMVNLDATNEQVYQKNLIIGSQVTKELDQNGGTREIDDETREQTVVILRQGDKEIPLTVQTKKPEVRGVLIVANGVENMEVKKWVIDAVSKVLDVPVHRVSVMPKNKS
jgi:stage III sporulation protein AG